MKKIWLMLAALCLAVGLTACGGQSTSQTASSTANNDSSAATITIANMSFGDPVTVAPGAKVTVKNDDSPEHSVTSRTAGQFDVEVGGGKQGTLTAPNAPGSTPSTANTTRR